MTPLWRARVRRARVPAGSCPGGLVAGGIVSYTRVSAPQPTIGGLGERRELPPAESGAETRPISHFLHILGHTNLELLEKLQIPL